MKASSPWNRRWLCSASLLLLLAGACGARDAPADQQFHHGVTSAADGAEVTFDATVLNNPVESGGHERFQVRAATGERLEVGQNKTLAPARALATRDNVH